MRLLAASLAALSLVGCASQNGAITATPSAAVILADSGTALDTLYNATGSAFKASYPGLPSKDKKAGKALFAQLMTCDPVGNCKGLVPAADAAVRTGNATDAAAQVTAAEALIRQVDALIPRKATP